MALPTRLPRPGRALRATELSELPPIHPASATRQRDAFGGFRRLWRYRWTIALSTLAGAFAVGVALLATPARYVAEARVLVGLAEPRVVSVESIVADLTADDERVQSEALVVQSRELARKTIDRLGLAQDPEFNPTLRPPSFLQRYVSPALAGLRRASQALLGRDQPARTPASAEERLGDAVIDNLATKVDVSVLGRSHVLSIKAKAEDPDVASNIANGLAQLYIESQRQSKLGATGEAEQFLGQRIAELRRQVQASDQALEQYRQRHSLYKGVKSGITEQQLAELNTQVIQAQAVRAEAESRLREAQRFEKQGLKGDGVPDVLRSPLIQGLKAQQVESERRLSEISGSLGERNPKMTAARSDLANVERQINAEIRNVVSGLRQEAGTAVGRHETLRRNFERLKSEMADVGQKSVELEALERDANANRMQLEEMLRRSKETVGQEQTLKGDAQVVSTAAAPQAATEPPKRLLFALGTFGAFFLSSVWVSLRDRTDRTFRRSDELTAATGLPVLTVVPMLRSPRSAAADVLRTPFSDYAESLRKLQIGLDVSNVAQAPRTVLFASSVPGEGKSVLVAALARTLAQSGRRILLVDADWRSPSQGRRFRCQRRVGLADFLTSDTVNLDDAVHHDASSGLDVLPSGALGVSQVHLLASERMRSVIETFARGYDKVLIDTPPVHVGAEVLKLARMVEKVVFVVRWGSTPQETALDALKQTLDAGGDVAGLVLSRVDPKQYQQYGYSGLTYHYGRQSAAGA